MGRAMRSVDDTPDAPPGWSTGPVPAGQHAFLQLDEDTIVVGVGGACGAMTIAGERIPGYLWWAPASTAAFAACLDGYNARSRRLTRLVRGMKANMAFTAWLAMLGTLLAWDLGAAIETVALVWVAMTVTLMVAIYRRDQARA